MNYIVFTIAYFAILACLCVGGYKFGWWLAGKSIERKNNR